MEQLRKKQEERDVKIKSQDKEIVSLKESYRTSQSQVGILTGKLADKEVEVKNLTEEKEDQERLTEIWRSTTEEKIKFQEEKISFLIESRRIRLEDKQAEVQKLEEEKEDLEQEINSLEENISKFRTLEADQARGRKKRKRLEAKLKEMKNMILITKRQEHSKLVGALKVFR